MMQNIDETMRIGMFLRTIKKIDNARYKMYHEDNHYFSIPKLLFKYDELEGREIYYKIKECVESFKGNLEWTLVLDENPRRYQILIPKLYEVCGLESNEVNLFGEEIYKDTCEKAIHDIPNLAEHLQTLI